MKLSLDTHLLLWAAGGAAQLPMAAGKLLDDEPYTLVFSAASLWEISIERGVGRADFSVDPRLLRRGLRDNGYQELPITSQHAVAIDNLPALHTDPFDRLLVAQATVEGMTLLTADALVAQDPGPIQRV